MNFYKNLKVLFITIRCLPFFTHFPQLRGKFSKNLFSRTLIQPTVSTVKILIICALIGNQSANQIGQLVIYIYI